MYTTLGIMILIWTVISIGWFLKHMGDYQRKENWIDWILVIPALIIAYMIGAIATVIHLVKRKD